MENLEIWRKWILKCKGSTGHPRADPRDSVSSISAPSEYIGRGASFDDKSKKKHLL